MREKIFPLFLIGMAIAAAGNREASAQPAPAQPVPKDVQTLHIGYTMSMFVGVSAQDAKAATRVWGERMLNPSSGPQFKVEVTVYDTITQLAEAVNAREVDVFSCPSRDYLEWKDKLNAELWGHGKYDEKLMTYVVLVNKEAGIHSLRALQGKKLIIAPHDKGMIPETWLRVLLLREGLPETETFFGNIKSVEKPDRALLPVFFKQADACVMRRDGYELLTELNPQLKERLQVLAESPFYLPGVFCVRKDFTAMDRETMNRNLIILDQSVEGRQILNLFRATGEELTRPEALDPAEKLFAEYKQLHARMAAAAPQTKGGASNHE